VAIVPAYFVAGPRQSTSNSGLRQKISLAASQTIDLDRLGRARSEIANRMTGNGFRATAGRHQLDSNVFRRPRAGVRQRQLENLRFIVQNFIGTGDFQL
jgi:hypothetical protein